MLKSFFASAAIYNDKGKYQENYTFTIVANSAKTALSMLQAYIQMKDWRSIFPNPDQIKEMNSVNWNSLMANCNPEHHYSVEFK